MKDYRSMPDEAVLKASYEDPAAFEILVERYEAAFLRKARSIVKKEEAAEDVVQDTFVKIYLYGKKFKPVEGARFSSWGYKILINTCFLWYKKMKRDREFASALDEEMEAVIPHDDSRERQTKLDKDYLESLFSFLPETFARMMRLYAIDGKSYEDIAKSEGISGGAVKTRMHRAKNMLKDISKDIEY